MSLVIFIVCGCINMLIAKKKGFNPFAWLLAAGFLGLIVIALMPAANAEGIDEALRPSRRKTGNTVGIVLSALGVVLMVILMSL